MSSGIVERVALGAYEAERPEPRSDAETAHLNGVALVIVMQSPLGGWFPVRWRVVDHNLPDGRPSMVVVEEDDDLTADYRFIVLGDQSPSNRQVLVTGAGVDPDGAPVSWLEHATPVAKPSDVGRWMRARAARRATL